MAKLPPDAVLIVIQLSKHLRIWRSTLCKLAQEGELLALKGDRHRQLRREAADEQLVSPRQ